MKKLTNKKGFTLMEMLIVVAIIIILVAIAVPSFNNSLNKANKATDEANLRAAESAASLEAVDVKAETSYYYTTDGELIKTDDTTNNSKLMGECKNHTSCYIKVDINADGETEVYWTTNGSDQSFDCVDPSTDGE